MFLKSRKHFSTSFEAFAVNTLTTTVFDCPLFSPDVIIAFENLDAGK